MYIFAPKIQEWTFEIKITQYLHFIESLNYFNITLQNYFLSWILFNNKYLINHEYNDLLIKYKKLNK